MTCCIGARGLVGLLSWKENGELAGWELLPFTGVVRVPINGITSMASSSTDFCGVSGCIGGAKWALRGGEKGGITIGCSEGVD